MSTENLEERVNRILRRSRISLAFTLVMIALLTYAFYYYVSRISALSSEVREREAQIAALNADRQAKQQELEVLEQQLTSTREDISSFTSALDLLQGSTRHLLNRQYRDAVEGFTRYISVATPTPESLNFLGYAEFRYAQYWAENSDRTDITEEQRQDYSRSAAHYFQLAKEHLTEAASGESATPWGLYNLALVYFFSGERTAALRELEELLTESPAMVEWLCEDGQFRRMRLHSETGPRFVEIVERAVEETGREGCWVTKPPRY